MASYEKSDPNVPIPALLVERAIALARAEAGLALVHTRRIVIRAVSALLGTIVACAFSMLTLMLAVLWPVLAPRIPLVNLLFGVLASVLLATAGAIFAAASWAGAGRDRKARSSSLGAAIGGARPAGLGAANSPASAPSPARTSSPATVLAAAARSAGEPARPNHDTTKQPRTVDLAERVSL